MAQTVDNFDIKVYVDYARRQHAVEETQKMFHMQEASSIPQHTSVIDTFPKLSELDLLLGVARTYAPWALFLPPKNFRSAERSRRSPFKFSQIAPSFGDDEQHQSDLRTISSMPCKNRAEEGEKQALARCLKQLYQLNDWLGDIIGKMGQFLQG